MGKIIYALIGLTLVYISTQANDVGQTSNSTLSSTTDPTATLSPLVDLCNNKLKNDALHNTRIPLCLLDVDKRWNIHDITKESQLYNKTSCCNKFGIFNCMEKYMTDICTQDEVKATNETFIILVKTMEIKECRQWPSDKCTEF